jgi:chromatin remodeling complex protein RSC6
MDTLIVTVDPTIDAQFEHLQQNITKLKTNLSDLQQQLRTLEKTVKKETKETKKREPKIKQPKMIGFDIPEKINNDLCKFMNMPAESSATRNAITAFIMEYITIHKLQDMADRKRIILNEELATLFKMTSADQITYFNLHKYISKLFL